MDDQMALFNQYENDYCNKSTDITRKIHAIANLSGGRAVFGCAPSSLELSGVRTVESVGNPGMCRFVGRELFL